MPSSLLIANAIGLFGDFHQFGILRLNIGRHDNRPDSPLKLGTTLSSHFSYQSMKIMPVLPDITTRKDIETLVDAFYKEARQDNLLGPIFLEVVGDRWDQHLEKMYRFWETILLNKITYQGSPFAPHIPLDLNHAHFTRWDNLFSKSVDAHFSGLKAQEAKERASKMAVLFRHKKEYMDAKGLNKIV